METGKTPAPIREGRVGFFDSRSGNDTVWTEDWEERFGTLLSLLGSIDRDDLGSIQSLLSNVRQSRELLGEISDPNLRALLQRLLDEVWEAARGALYGDIEPAKTHVAAAQLYAEQVRDRLGIR